MWYKIIKTLDNEQFSTYNLTLYRCNSRSVLMLKPRICVSKLPIRCYYVHKDSFTVTCHKQWYTRSAASPSNTWQSYIGCRYCYIASPCWPPADHTDHRLTDMNSHLDYNAHTGWPKNGTVFWYTLTSSNINRFSKLFHCHNQEKCVTILSLKIPPHLKCVATLPCEMSSVFKATIENKTTSVTTHF